MKLPESDLTWLSEQFERCRPWLQAAIDKGVGTHTIDDVWAALASGEAQIWPAARSVVVTEVQQTPRLKVMLLWLAGGDLGEIRASEPAITKWAKDAGCDLLKIEGRRGWARVFDGCDESGVVLTRRLVGR